MNWKLGKLVKNRTYMLWGVNLFDCEWTKTGESVLLKDFTTGIRKPFDIYTTTVEGEEKRFATLELAPNTWLFFLPE